MPAARPSRTGRAGRRGSPGRSSVSVSVVTCRPSRRRIVTDPCRRVVARWTPAAGRDRADGSVDRVVEAAAAIAMSSSRTSMPDRAPGDAAAAADAAGRAELVDPRRELVGQPLAVAVARPAAGSCRRRRGAKPAREAAVPGSLARRERRRRGRSAGRRCVQKHVGQTSVQLAHAEAALGDLRPARAVELREEPVMQAGGRDGIADRAAATLPTCSAARRSCPRRRP